jgi:hypothetical protein
MFSVAAIDGGESPTTAASGQEALHGVDLEVAEAAMSSEATAPDSP